MKYIYNQFIKSLMFLVVAILFVPIIPAYAATTPTNQLLKPIGSGAPTSYGDYISSSGGLNTYYSYFIEVPPGCRRMIIRIYDADVGMGGNHDWTNDTYDSSCTYRIYSPSGGTVSQSFTTGSSSGPSKSDNAWLRLARINNPTAGHWELRVDMSSAVTTGNDMNGFGIRAQDRDGKELNIYSETFIPLGVLGSGATQTSTIYPYVTSGCSAVANDWDGDNTSTTLCTLSMATRSGNYSSNFNGSGNSLWNNQSISGFNSDTLVADNGIWSVGISYTDTGASANFGVLYITNASASTPPPSTRNEPDTFRIYFPNNSGGAPVKPYLTQNLSHVSGPNPPTMGSTTRVMIGISIFNPAPYAITFSSSNLVTSNIPGSGTVYAGNPSSTQGAISSQPAIGGTGNILWNPGSLSASSSATLYYQVDVTPTSPGQKLSVTGSGSAGSTATFLDETANSTQAKAICTFGPLCELAITEGISAPTLALISSFSAYDQDGSTVVSWETGAETGTAGFNLLRKNNLTGSYTRINTSLLVGLMHAPQGGIYRYKDDSVNLGGTTTYKLEEIEVTGRKREHGPFSISVDQGWAGATPMHTPYSKKAHDLGEQAGQRTQLSRLRAQKATVENSTQNKGQVKISIKETGLYYLGALEIADKSGASIQKIQAVIGNGQLRITSQGKEIGYIQDKGNAGIYFYGQAIINNYSNCNIYWLTLNKGKIMKISKSSTPASSNTGAVFSDSIHFEEDRYALTSLFSSPDDDIWLWEYITGGGESREFLFYPPGAADQGEASITLLLQGATNTTVKPGHHVQISLNGTEIGSSQWTGTHSHRCTVTFDQSLLNNGKNRLTLKGLLGSGVPYSIFYLDSFDLNYRRLYQAENDRLLCSVGNNNLITVTGFHDNKVRVFNITDGNNPILVTNTLLDPSNNISFFPQDRESKYLVLSTEGLLSPASVIIDEPSKLKKKNNSAQYLVIAGKGLAVAAQELADLRASEGLETQVVKIEDIYDEFNNGIPHPGAIKSFLEYAYHNWNGNRPTYVVLAGDGSYDYKDGLGHRDNLIPPQLVKTPFGLFASDIILGDVAGNDGIPEIAVGRLPVVSTSELKAVISKMKNYKYGAGNWTGRIMMLADNPDKGGDFSTLSNSLAEVFLSYTVDKIYLRENENVTEKRAATLAGFDQGALVINYMGHGGIQYLAGEKLLQHTDVDHMQNNDRLPLVTAVTCVAGRFAIPGYSSLGEKLILKANAGAIAVWAPSGSSLNTPGTVLAGEFFKALVQSQEKIIGKAIIEAIRNYTNTGSPRFIPLIYNLLGDPAQELH